MAEALERRERELSDAKERAEDAAARLTMVFESTADSVVIVDRDWQFAVLAERRGMSDAAQRCERAGKVADRSGPASRARFWR